MLATLDGQGPAVVVGDRTGYLYAYHLSDGSPVAGWPVYDGGAPIDSTPSVAALNGTDLDSVFVGTGNAQYPTTGGYEAYGPEGNQLWHTTVQNPPTDNKPAGGVQASLTVADLQGGPDVFAGSLGQESYALTATSGSVPAGWPFFTADSVFSTGAVGDLYGSGQDQLVMGGASTQGVAYGLQYQNGGHVRVLNAQGQLIYDYDTNQEVDSSPAVGQFLTGGATGIVVGTGYFYAGASDTDKVLAFNSRLVPAWSQALDGCTESSPALVDINGQADVVEGTDQGPVNCGGTNAGSVWVLDGRDGAPLCHTPVASRVIGSVVTADPTGDGQPDLLVPTIHGVEVLTDTCQEVTVIGPTLGSRTRPLSPTTPTARSGSRSPAITATTKASSSITRSRARTALLPSAPDRGPCSTMTRPWAGCSPPCPTWVRSPRWTSPRWPPTPKSRFLGRHPLVVRGRRAGTTFMRAPLLGANRAPLSMGPRPLLVPPIRSPASPTRATITLRWRP